MNSQASVYLILNAGELLLLFPDDIVEQLTVAHVLHYQEQLFGSFNYLVELDDVGVTDQFQDVNLSRDSLNICYIDYSVLLQHFYGYLLAC